MKYKSRYEGDLVAKCYFAKHKLVWEVLDGGLKNKIEIQWSDIMALKANYLDDGPGTLDVVVISISNAVMVTYSPTMLLGPFIIPGVPVPNMTPGYGYFSLRPFKIM